MNTWLNITPLPKGKAGGGGLCYIAAAPEEWLEPIPDLDPLTQTITQSLFLKPGRAWSLIPLVSRSRVFKEESARNESGISYLQTVSGRPHGQSDDLHLQLSLYMPHRWVLLIKEAGTGVCYLMGKPGSGALMNIQYANDRTLINNINFTRTSIDRAFIYTGDLPF